MFAIIAQKIVFPKSKTPQSGMILVDEKSGKIIKTDSKDVAPRDVKTIIIKKLTITPGLIDCHTHVGLLETGRGEMGDDSNELSGPIMSQMHVLDGLDYRDTYFQRALKKGVTIVGVLPGPKNVIGGQGVALYTGNESLSNRIIKSYIGLKCAFGEVPRQYQNQIPRAPQTKMATMALFRQTLINGKNYWKTGMGKKRKDLSLEVLIPVFKQKVPLRVHIYRKNEIEQLLNLAIEFKIRIVLEHAYEAVDLTEKLLSQDIAVVCNPYFISPSRKEQLGICPKYPSILANKGVLIALTTNHPEIPISSLTQVAGLAKHHGLSWRQAMDSITLNPAKILGIDHLVGSIQEGKHADLIIWDGDPLYWRARPIAAYIKGRLSWGKEKDLK